jgi:hypothetical protein
MFSDRIMISDGQFRVISGQVMELKIQRKKSKLISHSLVAHEIH